MNNGNRFSWVFLNFLPITSNQKTQQKASPFLFNSRPLRNLQEKQKLPLFLRFYAKCKTSVLEIKKIISSFLDQFCSRWKLTQRNKSVKTPRKENKSRFLSFVRAFDQVTSAHRSASYLLSLLCLCSCLCLWQNWRNFKQKKIEGENL